MRYLLLPTALLLAFGSQAQDLHADGTKGTFVPPPMINSNQSNQRREPIGPYNPNGQTNIYQASSYLFTTWTLGVLRPYAGPARREWLKYNINTHQLIARSSIRNTEITHVVDMDVLREFTVGDSLLGMRLTYRRYLNAHIEEPALRTAFFEVHYDAGSTALLCRRTHTPATALPGPAGFTGAKDVLSYFLKTIDNQLTPIKLRSENILPALDSTHTAALTAYARQQQLDLTVERDVIRLLAYNDSLPPLSP
jgi:hypothetical protein